MKTNIKRVVIMLLMLMTIAIIAIPVGAANEAADTDVQEIVEAAKNVSTESKAWPAAFAVGFAAAGGAIAMGMSIGKALDGISRQPEATGNIRTSLMLGLVFIETLVIYSLIIAILIIFVL